MVRPNIKNLIPYPAMFDLFGLYQIGKDIRKYQKYWSNYKGEEIVIRSVVDSTDGEGSVERLTYRQTERVIRGTIQEVHSIPLGFKLTDVEEIVKVRDMLISPDTAIESDRKPERLTWEGSPIREVQEKFVSFSIIDELEIASDYDEASWSGEDNSPSLEDLDDISDFG